MAREVVTIAVVVDLDDTSIDDMVKAMEDVNGVVAVDVLDSRELEDPLQLTVDSNAEMSEDGVSAVNKIGS